MIGIMIEIDIVKDYDFIKPEIDEVDYLLDKVIKDCRKNYFHTFKYRCVYDIKFTDITNNEKVILNISHDCLELESKFYGLNKKIKIAKYNKLKFDEILKLTKKIYSIVSNIKIQYYLKKQIPIMHRHFFQILSQNPDYVKTHCNDLNNPLHFACRRWMIN